jgi:hypothetical protein
LQPNGAAMDFTRHALGVGIDKHGAGRLAEPLGKFRGKLVAGDDFHVLAGKCLDNQSASVKPKPIIAAQRVTVTDDESLWHSCQLSAYAHFGFGVKRDRLWLKAES